MVSYELMQTLDKQFKEYWKKEARITQRNMKNEWKQGYDYSLNSLQK